MKEDETSDRDNQELWDKERYFLAAVVDSSKDSIVTIDFESTITSWNKAAEDLYGYPAREAVGKGLSLVMLPEDIRQLFVNIERIKNSRNVEIYDTIGIRKGGELINLEIMLSPVKNGKDEVIGVSTIARDITPWVKADTALRKSEQKFRALVSQTTVGIYQADLSRAVTFANDTLCRMTGYKREELVGQEVWAHTYPEDLESEKQLFERFRKTGASFETEKRVITKDGRIIWMRESVSPIYNRDGELESSMGVLVDITDRKEIDRQKDEFISIATHELRTPFTSLQAYGEIIEAKLEQGDHKDILSLTKKLNKQIQRFRNLLVQLLDTGRISEGKLTLHKSRFDLTDLIASVVQELRTLSAGHDLKLRCNSPTVIDAEKERITQVLTNLISNAIKYSPEGGDITIDCRIVKEGVCVSVADEGIGIPEQFHSKVFDRFFRVETKESQSISGIGLGLYITSEIIKMHGGTIGVKSNKGKGSIFFFTLPMEIHHDV